MIKKNTEEIKLTRFSTGAGWACKLSPQDLAQVLGKMKVDLPENVIGFDTSEDCAVFPLDDDNYLIQSVDFFTPILLRISKAIKDPNIKIKYISWSFVE